MTLRYVQDDPAMPALEPGHHCYRVERGAAVLGLVASASTSRGTRIWYAFRPIPSRTTPWAVAVIAGTRTAAAERLVGGRP